MYYLSGMYRVRIGGHVKETSFKLVDEFGSGQPYAGLAYEVIDSEGFKCSGLLDSAGTGVVNNHFAGCRTYCGDGVVAVSRCR